MKADRPEFLAHSKEGPMPVARLTRKGQITLPASVREGLRLQPGDGLDFVPVEGGYKVVPIRREAALLRGRFAGRVCAFVPLQAMDDAIAEGVARRRA